MSKRKEVSVSERRSVLWTHVGGVTSFVDLVMGTSDSIADTANNTGKTKQLV